MQSMPRMTKNWQSFLALILFTMMLQRRMFMPVFASQKSIMDNESKDVREESILTFLPNEEIMYEVVISMQ